MKKQDKKIRISLSSKLFFTLLLCLLLLIIFIGLLNNFVMPSYYKSQKKNTLKSIFVQTSKIVQQEDKTELQLLYSGLLTSSQNALDRIDNSYNSRIIIWGAKSNQIIYDTRERRGLREDLYPEQYKEWFEYSFQSGQYMLKETNIPNSNLQSISLLGSIDGGHGILIYTPLAAISESVFITNRFLLIAGIAALLIGTIVMFFISRSFTKPIKQLSEITGNVAQLDFSKHYDSKGNDELSDLGDNINQMSDALESTISELKAANLKLESDIEKTEKQSQARKNFISNVSHELKTPLALIQTYSEGLKENIVDDEENRNYYCTVIEDEAIKMNKLLEKMIMLMQLESDKSILDIKNFDVCKLLNTTLEKYHPVFDDKNIKFPCLADNSIFVWADEFLIENVFTNYITNALNHVDENRVIEVNVEKGENENVLVSIFNSGNQIPEKDIGKIWDNFYKVDKSRTREYGGTGIGLSVVAAIMKAHNMPYGVKNHKNGVVFYIELESK